MSASEVDKHRHRDPFAEQKIEKVRRGIFGFFITRTRLTFLVIITIVILGVIAIFNIPRESDPEVKIPIAVVTTVFPGASPADVEDLITDVVESKVEELDDVKLVTSSSRLGISSITVEFEARADLERSIQDLKDKVGEVSDLPDDAQDPIVTEIRIDDQAIITFSFAGPLDDSQFKQLGELIQDELEKIPGVSEVNLSGVRAREFSIFVNQGELDRLGISLNQVVGAISRSNSDTPLGDIAVDSVNYNIRAVAKIQDLDDLKNIPITNVGGRIIFLKDIAQVQDRFIDQTTISRLSLGGTPAINTISLSVRKKTGGNIINIVDTAKQRITELQVDGLIPASVEMETSNDYSQFIRNDLKTLGTSGLQATVLIFIIILLALSFKEALLSFVSIPMTFLITLYVLYLRGDTLNSLSLFTLVLSLGLLVDAFVIILEGIFHNMRVGYSAQKAALLAVAHYKNPLFSGAFTTIAAFVPMLLVSGILGEFLKVLPITISITLLSSLFVSLVIVPSLAAVFLKRKNITDEPKESWLEKYFTNRLVKIYTRIINKFLRQRKKKWMFLGVSVLLFIASLGLLIGGAVPVELFPNVDLDFTFVGVELPVGTELSVTNEVAQEVENYFYTLPEVASFVTVVGQSSSGFSLGPGGSSREHLANLTVNFVDEKNRQRRSYEINDQIRKDLAKIVSRGKVTVEDITSGPPTGAPIEARITGDDTAVLDQLTDQLIDVLENTDGVIEITSDKQVSPADLTFTLDRQALAEAGLSVGEVSGLLRTALFGVNATDINVEGEDIDVVVRISEDAITSVEEIQNLTIINSFGQSFKLSRLADFSLAPALASIRHRDFQRTATVQANLEEGYTATEVVPQVEAAIAAINIPKGYSFDFGGEVEDIEQSFSELWNAMIVAVLLVILILVLQFDSFRKPLVIILALPFTLIGVVIGMLIFNLPFSFSVFLGIISLIGIVVNDSIVLLDKTKRNVEENAMSAVQAVINAGETRLQPILLTSATTIVGILPLAFADEFWLGLSISLMFGLAFATILQLFLIPMFYVKLEGKNALRRKGKKLKDAQIS